jgi:serine/threonine protein phosphatase PrpC
MTIKLILFLEINTIAIFPESMTTIEESTVFALSPMTNDLPTIAEHIKPRVRKMTSDIRQLDSAQDSVFTGRYEAMNETDESFDWCIITDGHGKSYYPDLTSMRDKNPTKKREPCMMFKMAFDSLDHQELVMSADPIKYIHEKIPDDTYHVNIGATFLMSKIYANRAEFLSVGDSGIRVYKNKTLVYKNELHKISSEKERNRIREQKIRHIVEDGKCPRIINETHLIMDDSKVVYFIEDDYSLSLTQSIGHHGKTGFDPELKTVEFEDEDEIQIILGSDGIFDMVCQETDNEFLSSVESAEELATFAENRWRQDWTLCITAEEWKKYMKYKDFQKTMADLKNWQTPNGEEYYEYEITKFPIFDDISCVVWSQK